MAIWFANPTHRGREREPGGPAVAAPRHRVHRVRATTSCAARCRSSRARASPWDILHGGASLVLAETLGSVAANFVVDRAKFRCLGQEINANHLRPVSDGIVIGTARPVPPRRAQPGLEHRNPRSRGNDWCASRVSPWPWSNGGTQLRGSEYRGSDATRAVECHLRRVPAASPARWPVAGTKGPLYLPEPAGEIVTRPTQTPPDDNRAPNSPQTVDSPARGATPAPEVTAPQSAEDQAATRSKTRQERDRHAAAAALS